MFFIKDTYERELKKLNKKFPTDVIRANSSEYVLALINLQFKYNKIDAYERDTKSVVAMSKEWTVEAREEELLKIDLKYNKIDDIEYEKRLNDIRKNPWAKIHFNYDESGDPTHIQTEVIYNEYFIKKLEKMGYSGETEDDLVESWLSQVFASNITMGDLGMPETDSDYITRTKIEDSTIIG